MQIYSAFTEGRISSLRVNLSASAKPNKKISLKQLAAMPESVHTELYLKIFNRIMALLPIVSPPASFPATITWNAIKCIVDTFAGLFASHDHPARF